MSSEIWGAENFVCNGGWFWDYRCTEEGRSVWLCTSNHFGQKTGTESSHKLVNHCVTCSSLKLNSELIRFRGGWLMYLFRSWWLISLIFGFNVCDVISMPVVLGNANLWSLLLMPAPFLSNKASSISDFCIFFGCLHLFLFIGCELTVNHLLMRLRIWIVLDQPRSDS